MGRLTQRTSATLLHLVREAFPELDERRHMQLTGLLRSLGSSHSWLRLREEFGVPGTESGPLTRWAIETILAAVRRGDLPDLPAAGTDDEEAP